MSTGPLGREVYIVAAARTPVGRRGGGLADVHPVDLAALIMAEVLRRARLDPKAVDDVILGCVNAIGAQAGNIARVAWLAGGLPASVPAMTLDRRCGSSLQAITSGAYSIAAGSEHLILAGGVESMSLVPIGSPVSVGRSQGFGAPYESPAWIERFGHDDVTQFRGAELAAAEAGISRAEMETFALESHRRALASRESGVLDANVVPVGTLRTDEGPRADTSLGAMAGLRPLLPGGSITAAVTSQISDGAAAVLLASAEAVALHELTPLARIVATANVGSDPIRMVTGPPEVTNKVLGRAGLDIVDIDRFEVNEAFASVVLDWFKRTGASHDRTNVNGGAIAVGHPLGASGARIMCDLVAELHSCEGRYGLQTMCEGAGTASATVIERC